MESTPEQTAEGLAVVRVLAAVLERLICTNASASTADQEQVTKFHALKAPGISILQYLERIHKYASCSTECFILALIYIDRLIQGNNFVLTELNAHRVIITSILLAAKFFDDAYYNNAYYAKVGGVHVSEMNRLEVEFLFRINFSLHVTPELYDKYHAELRSHASVNPPLSIPAITPRSQQQYKHEITRAFVAPQDTYQKASQQTTFPASESENVVSSQCLETSQYSMIVPHPHPPEITPSPSPPVAQQLVSSVAPYCPIPISNTTPLQLQQQHLVQQASDPISNNESMTHIPLHHVLHYPNPWSQIVPSQQDVHLNSSLYMEDVKQAPQLFAPPCNVHPTNLVTPSIYVVHPQYLDQKSLNYQVPAMTSLAPADIPHVTACDHNITHHPLNAAIVTPSVPHLAQFSQALYHPSLSHLNTTTETQGYNNGLLSNHRRSPPQHHTHVITGRI